MPTYPFSSSPFHPPKILNGKRNTQVGVLMYNDNELVLSINLFLALYFASMKNSKKDEN